MVSHLKALEVKEWIKHVKIKDTPMTQNDGQDGGQSEGHCTECLRNALLKARLRFHKTPGVSNLGDLSL